MTFVKPDGDDLKRAIKMAVAASIAWAIAARLTEQAPVFAAIVPLVAIRKQDPYSAINVSAGRILGVFVGVLIGLGMLRISDDVTTGLAIATICVSLMAGMVLRVGNEPNVQITVSALIMLFLANRAGIAGVERIWETAIGAAAAIVASTLMWPPNPVHAVRRELPRLHEQLCEDLFDTVELLENPRKTDVVLTDIREHQLDARDEALDLPQAERVLRWNLLHRGDGPDLDRLGQRTLLLARLHRHVRSLARSIADATPEAIASARPGYRELRRAAEQIAEAVAPRIETGAVQAALDDAAATLDNFAAVARGRLASAIELDVRRIVSDLRGGRIEGELPRR